MKPPPSTPAPRKFLLPKRGQPSQSQSTPRFGPPSSAPRLTQRESIEDVDDEDEDEEIPQRSSGEDDEPMKGRRGPDVKDDAIEIGSSISRDEEAESASDPENEQLDSAWKHTVDVDIQSSSKESSPTQREAKRRKLSITPLPAFSSPSSKQQEPSTVIAEEDKLEEKMDALSSGLSESNYHEEEHPSDTDTRSKAPQQPTFRPAPRFKLTEDAEPLGEGLPAAFSPQRRGAKYLTGGLAAELQGWLAEVKREDGATGSTFTMRVEEVRPGQRMYLVHGRVESSAELRKVILAGEGRLTGLGKRAVVGVGSVVEVGQPMWDVEVDGEAWTVACDWTVP